MNYASIKYNDIANGTGVRTSLFVSGCRNNCPECFNKEAQNFKYGELFTEEIKNNILESIDFEYISGLSLLGGDPLEPENAKELISLVKDFRSRYKEEKSIWIYSGYTYEFISKLEDNDNRKILLNLCDIMVDGLFINSLKDISLKFRGSSNQRIIDIKESIKNNKVYILEE